MSTYFYLQCEDHDPPIIADDESGQHTYDLPQIRATLADREALVRVFEDGVANFSYFVQHSLRFLSKHKKCRITLWNEYGEEYSTTGDSIEPLDRDN